MVVGGVGVGDVEEEGVEVGVEGEGVGAEGWGGGSGVEEGRVGGERDG